MVAGVAAEEHVRGWIERGADERADMIDGVAGGVEEVEGAVAEVVVGGEAADARGGGGEGEFDEGAGGVVGGEDGGGGVFRVGGGEVFFEAGADDEGGGGGEGGGVADVVPVVMAPDDSLDRSQGDGVVEEDVRDVFFDGDGPAVVP